MIGEGDVSIPVGSTCKGAARDLFRLTASLSAADINGRKVRGWKGSEEKWKVEGAVAAAAATVANVRKKMFAGPGERGGGRRRRGKSHGKFRVGRSVRWTFSPAIHPASLAVSPVARPLH